MNFRRSHGWVGLLFLLALGAAACGGGKVVCKGTDCNPGSAAQSFESDLPPGSGQSGATRGVAESAGTNAAAPAAGGAQLAADSSSNAAERAITEADIIQVDGDHLYALSRQAGLAVIDVAQPKQLKLLGRYRDLPAEPFEMYLRDGVALVMFSGWGQYVKNGDGDYQWVSTSKLVALDVGDPTDIRSLGSFDVPGSISDSRIVGDVLYLVAHEDGYCWGCEQNEPLTSIQSIDVTDPHTISKLDELQFDDGNASWGPRSVTVTDQRMYVAGPEYGSDMPTGSTIAVVDISDPKGALVQGASVSVEGQISSRWQMDEYDGVLRVISQPPLWWNGTTETAPPPAVQTFKVTSSDEITPLGRTDIQLPARESLRSARFDGPRAYAITAEQRDPLFTIDLSDPKNPRQVGELQMPGFVYYMEPRGERLLGLGFDQGNPDGSIAVSLFDVKDLANPKLLSRVNFGGSWGQLPEDQDRIHKVFRVLDDAGLILVPFSGWNDLSVDSTCQKGSGYVGGVQLIDFANDTLKARGAARDDSQTRRALLHDGSLLTVSDEQVQSFDIADRDAPKKLSQIVLSRYVSQALQLDGGVVARMSYQSNSGVPYIDLVAAQDAGDPNQRLGEVDLSTLTGNDNACVASVSINQIFVHGSELDLSYTRYGQQEKLITHGLLVVDASDPENPRIASNSTWQDDGSWNPYYGFYRYGSFSSNASALRTDSTLTMLETHSEYTGVRTIESARLRVYDLRDPSAVSSSVLALGEDVGFSGLIADGDMVYTSHFTESDPDSTRARFYVDRFDVSDPSAPKRLASINVPGALLYYDHASGRALTSELTRTVVKDTTADDCYQRFAYAEFVSDDATNSGVAVASSGSASGSASTPMQNPATPDAKPVDGGTDVQPSEPVEPPPPPMGICTGYVQHLHMVHLGDSSATLDDTYTLDEDQQMLQWSAGKGVVFGTVGNDGYYGGGVAIAEPAIACRGCGGAIIAPAPNPVQLLVLGGFDQGKFAVGQMEVDNQSNPWWGFWGTPPIYAYGDHALLLSSSDIAILNASDPSAPKIERTVPLIASAQNVDIRDDTALLTLGAQGVQWLSLK